MMMPLPFKKRLRNSFYVGLIGFFLSIPCTWLAMEVCFFIVPNPTYTTGKVLDFYFFRAGFCSPLVIRWELLLGLVAATAFFVFPGSPALGADSVPRILGHSAFISFGVAGFSGLLYWLCERPRDLHDLTLMVYSFLFLVFPVYCVAILLRCTVMLSDQNSSRLRYYFLGILVFLPLMWFSACLMDTGHVKKQYIAAFSTGAGLTVFMAAGLVDLIRAWDRSS